MMHRLTSSVNKIKYMKPTIIHKQKKYTDNITICDVFNFILLKRCKQLAFACANIIYRS